MTAINLHKCACAGGSRRIDAGSLPPCYFVAMDLAMMTAAKRHGEFIAHLSTECPMLRKTHMMRI